MPAIEAFIAGMARSYFEIQRIYDCRIHSIRGFDTGKKADEFAPTFAYGLLKQMKTYRR